jgi:hypothetical protein
MSTVVGEVEEHQYIPAGMMKVPKLILKLAVNHASCAGFETPRSAPIINRGATV